MTQSPIEVPMRSGLCSVCASDVTFLDTGSRSIRENYACPVCDATLRYRHQAAVIVELYGVKPAASISAVARAGGFADLDVYEPGVIGPFRDLLASAGSYIQSYFWPDVPTGELHKGTSARTSRP